jgi:hypothetical protein
MLHANRVKKGYYIKRLKDALWGTFGISKIKPFKDSYIKEQMREWKLSDDVRKVHDELYNPNNPDDPSSDSYISLIIQSVFTSKERTKANALWAQSVLEVIFDERYLDSKIDVDIVDSWTKALSDAEMINDIQA